MSNEEKLYCVYKHTSPNGKVYIGITHRKPESRWGRDGCGYKNNQYFWRAIQKYGWNNFKHEILYKDLNKNDACQKEKELISIYDSTNPERGYNISLGGEGTEGIKRYGEENPFFGKHHSEEAKNKIRAAHLGHKDSDETRQKKSAATKGENNPRYGQCITDETRQKISQALCGKETWMKGKSHTDETKYKMSMAKFKKVIQYDLNGNIITEFISVKEASMQTGIDKSCIANCCRGIKNHATAGGFIWRYKEDE